MTEVSRAALPANAFGGKLPGLSIEQVFAQNRRVK